ncbi:YcgL domain-containing protein [Gallaecimonas sp. GXIMD4217]|uniref:YcgL domain-containing protein n=1 Tax=Gallaecimonas sp. GXIMD4217 TaxID=3131927 RepID=UPI00311AD9C8
MLCAIYKSSKKDETYLFLPKKDDFSQVPKELMAVFGQPQLVMMLKLEQDRRLAMADAAEVMAALADKGYFLQLPPPKENLLKQHRAAQGLEEQH